MPRSLEAGLQRSGHLVRVVKIGGSGEVGEGRGGQVIIAGLMAVMSPPLPDLINDCKPQIERT